MDWTMARYTISTMPKRTITDWIIQGFRRLSVVVAAVLIILGYLYLLNYFGNLYGAGQGWDNSLLWFACALSALVVLVAICWALTKLVWLATGRKPPN